MPTVSSSSPEFRFSRTWERNGPGPKVPHSFTYSMVAMRRNNYSAYFSISNGGAGTHPGSVPTNLRLTLYQKMREKAYESLQLGADIGEGRQTVEMVASMLKAVRSPLRTMGDYMRKAARRRGRQAAGLMLKDVSEAFLTFQYGVRPLIGSISDACKILSHPYPRHHASWHGSRSYMDPDYVANSFPKGANAYLERTTHEVDLKGYFEVVINNPALHSAEQMGLLNPALIAWELVPFSFVVDWFLPIGTYIGSLSDYAGCTFKNAYETSFIRTNGLRSFINRGQFCEDEAIMCRRTLGVSGLPSVGTMRFNWGQSKEHVANALALIVALRF